MPTVNWLLCFLFPLSLFGQQNINGVVIDHDTKEKIPFATIGLIKQNNGVNADENGNFRISGPASLNLSDTLLVTNVGYWDKKVPVKEFPENGMIELSRKQTEMDEVVINGKYNWQFISLNENGNCGNDYWVGSNDLRQMAQHFYVPVDHSILSSVQICKYGISIIDPSKCIFRLRIYDMDSVLNSPSFDLADTIIEVKASGRHVQIDLEKYHIVIPGHHFFVAVEWLRIPYNQWSETFKQGGIKKTRILYAPDLAVKTVGTSHCWIQGYNGKWRMLPYRSAQISATLKY